MSTSLFCKYHPKLAARWECFDCDIAICGSCASKDTVRNTAQCPVCQHQLEPADATNFIQPFWQRIPKFFRYPANGQSLMFVVLIGLFLAFAPFGGFLSIALMILFSLAFMRYAMLVLEFTADGRDKPPDVTINVVTSGYLLPVKMLATYFVFGYAVLFLGDNVGAAAGIISGLFVLACLPASTMTIATTHSFMHAINPLMLIGIIRAIGKPYWILYLFLILLSACQAAVTSIVGAADSFLLWPMQNAIGLYFTLIMFSMMGYVIFQYHEPLGYSVRLEVDQDYGSGHSKAKKASSSSPAVQEAELLIKEGKIPEAIERLRAAITGPHVALDVHAYYHHLLLSNNNVEPMAAHAREYLNMLLYEKKTSDAAKLINNCYQQKAVVRPNDPDNYYPLAYALKDMRAYKACMALLNNFHVQFPGHSDIPKLYLLGAHVLSEELHNDDMAKKILEFLKTKYPQHEMKAEIDHFYDVVKSVANG